jgi:hypothetical protein
MSTLHDPFLLASLKDWRSLTQVSSILTEGQLLLMLEHEKNHLHRPTILVRLHQVYSKLRNTRERAELAECSK